MKLRLLIFLLILTNFSFAQNGGYVAIPGTKYALIPPANFVVTSNFGGFQNEATGSSIMVNEIPAPYKTMIEVFTADQLKAKGMILIKKETIELNSSKATLLHVQQPANNIVYLKQILIFGDDSATVLVNGIYPESRKSIEVDMTKALLSIKYDPKQEEASLEAASFTIDVTGTGFKLAKYLSGSLIYTVGGEIPSTKPMIIVGSSFGNIPVADRQKYSLERLRKIPGLANAKIDMVKEITIDGLSGYEIIAYSNSKDNKKELSYQVMLFEAAGGYYIIFGQAKEDFQQNLNTFKSIAGTFKEK